MNSILRTLLCISAEILLRTLLKEMGGRDENSNYF